MATLTIRGHEIYTDGNGVWRYNYTGERCEDRCMPRDCGNCGQAMTDDDHDACIANMPGVANACCGHGNPEESYIQFWNGLEIREFKIVQGKPIKKAGAKIQGDDSIMTKIDALCNGRENEQGKM